MPFLHIITNRFPATPDDQASPFVRDFAQALLDRGVGVEVTTPAYSPARENPPGIHVNWIPWTGSKEVVGGTSLLNPADLIALGRFLKAGRSTLLDALRRRPADHCLALWALPSGWFARRARLDLGIPYSVWCLGSDIYYWAGRPIVGAVVRRVLRDAAHLFADGHDLCERTRMISGRSCAFLPSLRVLPRVRGAGDLPRRVRFDFLYDFLYVGRFDEAKGVSVALEGFAAARSRSPGITLGLVGWGPSEGRLRALAARYGLGEAVSFLGKGGPNEVAEAMASSRCLLVPSYSDSIPLVFGEALQAKIPLIVTDVGDLGSLTRKHELGHVVSPGDARALAAAMVAMLSEGPPSGYETRMDALLAKLQPDVAAERFLGEAFGR